MRVSLVVLAVLAVSCSAEFGLQYESFFTVTADSTPEACFSATSTSILFNYKDDSASSSASKTRQPIPERSCGASDGQHDALFTDRVWAVKRNGDVANGDCLDLWNGADAQPWPSTTSQKEYLVSIAGSLKANQAGDNFNLPYRLIITRRLWACKYDSNFDNGRDMETGVLDNDDRSNDDAVPKIAFRREEWHIFHMDFNSEELQDITGNSFVAGAKLTDVWNVPTSANDATASYKPFADGSTSCVGQSTRTCPPATTAASTECPTADFKDKTVESYGCASSAQLLARANPDSVDPQETWKTFAGLSKDFFGPEVDGTEGLVSDLWSRVSARVSSLDDKTLNSENPSALVVGSSWHINQNREVRVGLDQYQDVTGFYTNSLNAKIRLSKSAAVYDDTTSISNYFTTKFDLKSKTLSLLDGDDEFEGAPDKFVWACLQTDFKMVMEWSCKSIGPTVDTPSKEAVEKDNKDTYGRFRYNCDVDYQTATTTAGRPFNNPTATYPAVKRQYVGYEQEVPFSPTSNELAINSLNADPVFVGFLNSETNAAFAVQSPANGVDGKVEVTSDSFSSKTTDAVVKQGNSWEYVGLASIFVAVLLPLFFMLASVILGKANANDGKSLDVNFSGAKNKA